MEFIDANTYAAPGHYNCPNEDTRCWREGIKGMVLFRAAGICSGGEVGFFSILPAVRRKLVLVDHSYLSLHVAITKYLVLAAHGPKETYRLFTKASHEELLKVVQAVEGDLPDAVRNCPGLEVGRGGIYTSRNYGDWRAPNPKSHNNRRIEVYNTKTHRYEMKDNPNYPVYVPGFNKIQRHWNRHITLDLVQKAYKKLHLVKFIHGDLRDIAEDGPYGLIYLSNALEHSNRDGQRPALLDHVRPSLRKGGVLVTAGYYYDRYSNAVDPLSLVKKFADDTSSWGQSCYRFAEDVTPQAVAA